MVKIKRGTKGRKRHKRVLKQARGFYGLRSKSFKNAKITLQRSLCYSYRDRKRKKREFRNLWIVRINSACKLNSLTYSSFINSLKNNNIIINRKFLANIAFNDILLFNEIAKECR